MLVCEISLKKLCVDQVSVNSGKAGRRDFCQSILTYWLKPMCPVKINMPRILKWEIGLKRLCRVLFCIWILFPSEARLLLLQINVPGSQLDIITSLIQCGWFASVLWVAGESVNKIMFIYHWCPCTTRKTNCSLPNGRHLKLILSKLKKTFWTHIVILLITKWQNLLTVVVTSRRFMKVLAKRKRIPAHSVWCLCNAQKRVELHNIYQC